MENILEVSGINYSIKGLEILNNVSFSIPNKKFVILVGKNGAGKSTLLKCILGLINNYQGEIKINDINAKIFESRKYISYIPSEFYKLNNTTIKKFLLNQAYLYGLNKQQAILKIQQVCNDIGFPYKRIILPFNVLSSGLKKVVLIIQALINPNVKLIIADEPFVNLDFETRNIFTKMLIKIINDQNISVLCTTHNKEEMKDYADIVLNFVNGELTTTSSSEASPSLDIPK